MRPVEIGLLGCEQVQVPLPRLPVWLMDAGPGWAAEHALPVVGRQRPADTPAVAKEVPLSFGRTRAGGHSRAEPRMLVRRVVGHEIDDHSNIEPVRGVDERAGVGKRAEGGLNVAIVRHVIAAVGHWRRVPGGDPDGVDAELAEVRQALADAVDIADAVAVGVGEAAHVNLIDDGMTPPRAHRGRRPVEL